MDRFVIQRSDRGVISDNFQCTCNEVRKGFDLHTRKLGSTDLTVTPLGLGLAALGRPGYINLGHADDLVRSYEIDAMREHAHLVLDAAWAAGVRYFDTARSYGRAEEFLSSWIARRQLGASDLTVGSKWGYSYTADWQVRLPAGEKHEVKDHTLPVLNRQFDESRSLLSHHLDLYQIHSATLESGVLDNDGVLSRLAELRDAGLSIGFSVSGPQQSETIRRGLEIELGGKPVFATVQATWNLLEQSAGKALAEACAAGRGVIIKEALANGRLTTRNCEPDFQTRHQQLFRFAARSGVTVDAVAIACVLSQPWVDVVLSGAARVEHLTSNLDGLRLICDAELDELTLSPESATEYWSKRSKLAWN